MNAVDYYTSLIDWVFSHARVLHEYMFLIQSIVTCTALFWLLRRAWEVLWTPLPRLISILGVEVPDPPEVSLACIKSDALTLHWSSSPPNKGVVRYIIQVNGVDVGESTQGETVIIEGLKPGNFYNVRVIAVGTQNFQAGSRVIRLRTLGRDGLPRHGVIRNEADLSNEDQHDAGGESLPTVRAHGVSTDGANPPAATVQVVVRESSVSHPSQRRNTVGRKHSQSTATATAENWSASNAQPLDESRETIQELQEQQDRIQKELEDVIAQGLKESEEIKNQILLLSEDKDKKTEMVKDKEEASETLRKEVKNLEVKNRQAQSRKTALQKSLQAKQVERKKMQDEQARWKKEMKSMGAEMESWSREAEEIRTSTEAKCEELRENIRNVQDLITKFTREVAEKGLLVKSLEEEREGLGIGLDDDQAREWEALERRNDAQWEAESRTQHAIAQDYSQRLERLENELQAAQANFTALYARLPSNPNELMNHANSSGVDFDPNGQHGRAKSRRQRTRKSRTNTVSSTSGYAMAESQYSSTGIFNNFNLMSSPAYAAAPYLNLAMSNDTAMASVSGHSGGMSEADIQSLTAGAPLSPTATMLLPSTLFNDDELQGADEEGPEYMSELHHSYSPPQRHNDAQSPGSSRSASLMSSPHASSQNLAKYGVTHHDYALDADRTSLGSPSSKFGVIGSPARTGQSTSHRNFGSMFTSLRKSEKTPQDGLPLGSLKGQSHSFPRSTDEPETPNRARRISFSSGWGNVFQRSATVGDSSEGNAPAPARPNGRRQLGFSMFGFRNEDTNHLRSARDPSSPRPTSIASSDLPRPSTDSAPFGWGPGADGTVNKSPLVTDWSVSAPPTWSSNPSRRPSFQHGSSSALASEILSGSDEYFYEDNIHSSPPPNLGAIGTRPPSSHNSVLPKLNPNAPKFELPQTSEPVFSRLLRSKGKGKAPDQNTESFDPTYDTPHPITSSPSESRKSRDSPSIHTQNSVAESIDSLDRTKSNTASDIAGSAKGESSFTKLLRKGSSSKFSLGGKDSIFGRKKGGSSTAASDHNDRDEGLDDLGDSLVIGTGGESATSSPRIGGFEGSDGKAKGATRERKSSTWGRFQRKKRESSEIERSERSEAETTGTEDEHE
ncbi:putative fibronectin type iii domain-containing protein [Botrytis fragariae]|uniref:Putative fibronectin type iii domain-containing protein n=1 Tax=Botrytis fragariae TaxID=1964551 RepID=A0A8H6EGX5_9HELO|nr:putative fibronectin type iii domain-containing protein [Botrytis fragariae]KAF5871741.1 putative fibronectin type iii domain-containing protein [Botrytis fragariae]